MFFEQPTHTEESGYVMCRTREGENEITVFVHWARRDGESGSWMEVGEAVETDDLVIQIRESINDFRAELAHMVEGYGLKAVEGKIWYEPIAVLVEPETRRVDGYSFRKRFDATL